MKPTDTPSCRLTLLLMDVLNLSSALETGADAMATVSFPDVLRGKHSASAFETDQILSPSTPSPSTSTTAGFALRGGRLQLTRRHIRRIVDNLFPIGEKMQRVREDDYRLK